ncbi:hypothetical protein [Mycolicibacterium smegmatis]|uniref:Uncharacterized protein n=2 Tax=Mycolicibacterium smegmatis (strain ATCC 700084 / mc(2)155) TaxID=246196 RepID=I7GGC6_MYCS2|nr:hypothetical protein [Mycolicibacterium smegmatis]ABK70359.1 hypothetical protein MSMEG_6346 [Mycolicibacterium smegmatis MC2 155]AFP42609.1 hypothetical protein MSMEI_6180 [Mycolicibacterium smegmatis MC2 155]AIU11332.1 hypothetical protein LJ00_31375 [Mycolicibacterium smegmatis MC2 155]AIU17956.1 hypothetical protein LI99_31380 [Mycolicibacterium smegmatis]AIU24580.1 hypothetical protein LI98_31385 [Mycolicibacterium smegmatis]
MGHKHAMATAKVMRTAAFTGCDSPHGDVRVVRARAQSANLPRQAHHAPSDDARRRRYTGLRRTTALPGRSPWMNDRVTVLLRYLTDDHGLHVPVELARVQVTGHVDLLVSVLRLDRQTARRHVTDEVLRELACDIAATLIAD